MDPIEPSNLKGDIGSPSAPKSDGNDYSNSTAVENISMWLVKLSSTPETACLTFAPSNVYRPGLCLFRRAWTARCKHLVRRSSESCLERS